MERLVGDYCEDLLVLLLPQVGVVGDPLQEDDPLRQQESLVGLQPLLLSGQLQQLEDLGSKGGVADQTEVEEDVVQGRLEPADSVRALRGEKYFNISTFPVSSDNIL